MAAVLLLALLASLETGRRHWLAHDLEQARVALGRAEPAVACDRLRRWSWLAPLTPDIEPLRAECAALTGNYAAAEALFDPLVQRLEERVSSATQRARLLTLAAEVDLHRDRPAGARRRADAAEVEARRSGRPEALARARLAAARIALADQRPGDALSALHSARQLAEKAGDHALYAAAQTEIGNVRWWYLGEVEDPRRQFFEPARATFRRLGDRNGESRVLDYLAQVSLRADDLVTFFNQQNQSLDYWQEIGHLSRQAQAHLQIGWAWDRLENPRRAMYHLDLALQLSMKAGDLALAPRAERMLATVELTAGRPRRAQLRLERVIASLAPGHPEGRSIYGVLGDAYRRQGQSIAARSAYRRALELDQLDDPSFRVWIGSGLARVALQLDEPETARVQLADLEQRMGPTADWSDRRRVLSLQASLAEHEHGPRAALPPLLEAAEIETRSLGTLGGLTIDHGLGILGRLLPTLLDSPAAEVSAATTSSDVWATEAFRLIEQARVRPARRHRFARVGAGGRTTAPGAAEVVTWAAAREASKLAADEPSPERLAEMRRAYARYEEEALRARSGVISPESVQGASVAEIQAELSQRATVVSYLLVRDLAVALVVRHDRFEALRLPMRPADLVPRTKVLQRQLAAGRGSGWRAPARELGRLLIDPLIEAGLLEGTDRLYVVPMGELHEMPFAVLLDASGEPLSERLAIARLPAASALLDSQAERSPRDGGLVLLRDRFAEHSLPDLPAARREAAAVARASRSRVVDARQLDEQRIRQLMVEAGYLHVISHARSEPTMPMLSRLTLATAVAEAGPENDGELTVRELIDLRLQAELVTLSACRSGLAAPSAGPRAPELRRTGLVEGFLLAGARNVLATLVPVEDEATAELMSAFARQLRRQPPIDALATVQRAAAAGTGLSSHPRHWSAFVLTGPGDRRVFPRRPTLSSEQVPDSPAVSIEEGREPHSDATPIDAQDHDHF